jgi:hypothetical protein
LELAATKGRARILKDLNLEELLRYGFSGGLLLVVLLLMHPSWRDDLAKANGIGGTAILMGVSLLAGSLIYALHRALAYRLLFTLVILFLILIRKHKWNHTIILPLCPSETELRIDRWRLRLKATKDFMDPFTAEWGAQVHLLYCSAWAILLGKLLAPLFPNCQSIISQCAYYVAFIVLLVAALWQNARLILWIKANEDQCFPEAVPGKDS